MARCTLWLLSQYVVTATAFYHMPAHEFDCRHCICCKTTLSTIPVQVATALASGQIEMFAWSCAQCIVLFWIRGFAVCVVSCRRVHQGYEAGIRQRILNRTGGQASARAIADEVIAYLRCYKQLPQRCTACAAYLSFFLVR